MAVKHSLLLLALCSAFTSASITGEFIKQSGELSSRKGDFKSFLSTDRRRSAFRPVHVSRNAVKGSSLTLDMTASLLLPFGNASIDSNHTIELNSIGLFPDESILEALKVSESINLLEIINLALNQKRFQLVESLLHSATVPFPPSSAYMEVFQQVIAYKTQHPHAPVLQKASSAFLHFIFELAKTAPICDSYRSVLKAVFCNFNDAKLKSAKMAAIETKSLDVCIRVLPLFPDLIAGKLVMLTVKEFNINFTDEETDPCGKSNCRWSVSQRTQLLNYIKGNLGFGALLVDAFKSGETGIIESALAHSFWNCLTVNDLRVLLNNVRYDDISYDECLHDFLERVFDCKLQYSEAQLVALEFENSLVFDAIIEDDSLLLKQFLNGRVDCPLGCVRRSKRYSGPRYILTESEVLQVYDVAIKARAKKCIELFFTGLFDWTEKVNGHRFMAYAFSIGEFNFAIEMMNIHKIDINSTDTPDLNPNGDLLLYAYPNLEAFAYLLNNGAYPNPCFQVGQSRVPLLHFLEKNGHVKQAELLRKRQNDATKPHVF